MIEVLKQALEALEACNRSDMEEVNEAITAIREALVQPKHDYERGFVDGMQKQMQSSVDKAVNRMAQEKALQALHSDPDGKRA
jgi:hypothetical protein